MATRRCVQSAAPDLVRRAGSLGADIRDFTGRALTEPVHGLPDVALQVLWLLAAVTRECGEVFAGRRRLPRIPGDLRPLVGRQGILPLVDALPGLDLDRWEGLLAEARYALGRLGLPISAPERATMDQLFEAAVQLGRAGRETVLRKRERQLHTMDQALEAACTAVRRGGGDTQDMETALRHAADALGRGARPAGAGSDLRAVLALAVAAPQLGTRRHAFRLELRVENTGDAPARAIASRAWAVLAPACAVPFRVAERSTWTCSTSSSTTTATSAAATAPSRTRCGGGHRAFPCAMPQGGSTGRPRRVAARCP